MSDPNMPTSPEETPENPAPTTNQDPVVGEPAPAPEQPEAPETRPEDTVDYWKNRHAESSRENQVILGREKEKDARIEQLTKQHPPTDTELREAFPEWEQMLPHEQRLAKENLALRRSLSGVGNDLAEVKARQAWDSDLKKATKAFPTLKGKEDDFEAFVMKPAHRTTPIEVLAKAFLSDTPPPPAAPVQGRPGVQRGNAGPKDLPSTKKMTAIEAGELRKSNFAEYKRQLDAGNIDLDDV
jgi:hypothetical protein